MPYTPSKRDWMKRNRIVISLSLMTRTEQDIIERLAREPKRATYIKRLIRDDIKREEDGK